MDPNYTPYFYYLQVGMFLISQILEDNQSESDKFNNFMKNLPGQEIEDEPTVDEIDTITTQAFNTMPVFLNKKPILIYLNGIRYLAGLSYEKPVSAVAIMTPSYMKLQLFIQSLSPSDQDIIDKNLIFPGARNGNEPSANDIINDINTGINKLKNSDFSSEKTKSQVIELCNNIINSIKPTPAPTSVPTSKKNYLILLLVLVLALLIFGFLFFKLKFKLKFLH